MKKAANAVSVIGGADGPTSIFVAGRQKGKKSLIQRYRQHRYRKHRAKVEASIQAQPHTLDEVITYIKEIYSAEEGTKESFGYKEGCRCLKESLILQYKPQLLGEFAEIAPPKNCDETSLKEFWTKIEARTKKAEAVPDEMFPMDYHTYTIYFPNEGEIHIQIEKNWGVLTAGYSGAKNKMKKFSKIVRDIYLYYGVTKADIKNRSNRYRELISVLSRE